MAFQSIVLYSVLLTIMLLFALSAYKPVKVMGGSAIYQHKTSSFFNVNTILPLIVFAVFFGVRYDVGTDHLGYLQGYIWHIDVGKGEPLFEWLTHLFQHFDLHFSWYFGAIAFIQAFFFFFAFNKERYIFPLLTFFFFMNGDFMFWMNGIRQALALCIWIFALKFIEERSLWKYLLMCVIAYGFHSSAIILVILYPVLRNGKDYFSNIPLQLILLGSAFAVQQLFSQLLPRIVPFIENYIGVLGNEAYEGYVEKGLEAGSGVFLGTGLGYFFRIGLAVTIILYSKRLKYFYQSKRFNIIYFLFFIGLITMYIFPVGSNVLTRPFRYFYAFQFIMYAYFAYYLLKSRGLNQRILFAGIITAFLGLFYLNQITADEYSHIWYQYYFQQ